LLLEFRYDLVASSRQGCLRYTHNAADKAKRQPNDHKHVENPSFVFIQRVEGVGENVAEFQLLHDGFFGFVERGARHKRLCRREGTVERCDRLASWEERIVEGLFAASVIR